MPDKETKTLDQLLVPSLLPRIYTFWFQHIPSNERLLLPSPEDWMKWFVKSDDFDSACSSQFSSILTAIREANLSAEEILSRTKPSTPQDWLALVILLDQLPRNTYRGESSRIVFEFFDPLARTIALKAGEAGSPAGGGNPFRYRQGQRIWFYMPFIHSEDLDMQELARVKYQEMAEDFTRLLDGDATGLSDDEAECRRILLENRARLEEQLKTHFRVHREHYDPIARFGRFPHRNVALGRETSDEERKFLEEGKMFG
ncbi:hypothetical protein IFM58399_01251 [Aspergillus lentulus]|uniref:DUF924-domain-containing protein n=1 Tax=Aspergillus lentulus TaxID=293939 RepID=A0AAN6BQN4_ASPLE|nr:uncharacterized protein IFM58399_01251 [Aspergillus lentulus]KAF4166671.1 hypothetical protein CNMCM6936_006248 [Aspergillus lentulus]KAF4205055.1 hypothetical protein CNMCM8927_006569 [Aspergillus lentulus]GFF26008.1 hypothetical protein IFM58399_01251 [Aspergillus lentulus]GFF45179.1 hypothetical protein IFM62136_00188 [Aspergillus lentulus]GFF62152.1 hypothetical protein IFM60648_00540 [Aspergillus lentulus]